MLPTWGSKHEEQVDPAPSWEEGTLSPQRPQLARPEEFRRRRRTDSGASSHLHRNEFAVRVPRKDVYFESANPKIP